MAGLALNRDVIRSARIDKTSERKKAGLNPAASHLAGGATPASR